MQDYINKQIQKLKKDINYKIDDIFVPEQIIFSGEIHLFVSYWAQQVLKVRNIPMINTEGYLKFVKLSDWYKVFKKPLEG